MPWSEKDIANQTGRVAVVTGANSGIGLFAAQTLAKKGAEVILACRNLQKAGDALTRIRASVPGANVRVESLDLASLASVRAFAARMQRELPRLDLLVNNAGIMAIPRALTADGFEMQLGTNHLGHFALTGLLLSKLLATSDSRVVTLSSGVHHYGRIDFDDLMGERRYDKWRAYCQSKLANLLFALELDRRLRRAAAATLSVAAHPGYAATNLQYVGPELTRSKVARAFMSVGNAVLAQSAEMGAHPTLRAATDPSASGGQYYGPGGFRELRGAPVLVKPNRRAQDGESAAQLWDVSTRLTGVTYVGV
jgi:NAD(P)-dependent dehydrogenase (short-subunit alcohol dehydrogenase family)